MRLFKICSIPRSTRLKDKASERLATEAHDSPGGSDERAWVAGDTEGAAAGCADRPADRARPGREASGGAHRQRCDQPRQRRLRGARPGQGCRRTGPTGGAGHRHPRRSRHLDALDHQGDPRQPGAGGQLRRPQWRPRRQRRHLHPVCQPYRRHGPGHQPRGRHPGAGRHAGAARPGRQPARRATLGQEPGTGTRHPQPETDQRRRGLYPRPGAIARAQRRMGGTGRARGRQPAGPGSLEAEGGRLCRG